MAFVGILFYILGEVMITAYVKIELPYSQDGSTVIEVNLQEKEGSGRYATSMLNIAASRALEIFNKVIESRETEEARADEEV